VKSGNASILSLAYFVLLLVLDDPLSRVLSYSKAASREVRRKKSDNNLSSSKGLLMSVILRGPCRQAEDKGV